MYIKKISIIHDFLYIKKDTYVGKYYINKRSKVTNIAEIIDIAHNVAMLYSRNCARWPSIKLHNNTT